MLRTNWVIENFAVQPFKFEFLHWNRKQSSRQRKRKELPKKSTELHLYIIKQFMVGIGRWFYHHTINLHTHTHSHINTYKNKQTTKKQHLKGFACEWINNTIESISKKWQSIPLIYGKFFEGKIFRESTRRRRRNSSNTQYISLA